MSENPSNHSPVLRPRDRRETLNPFELSQGEESIVVEFEPQWYKKQYLMNYESQDD